MSIVALILVPVVLAYQGWSYWIFRKRITESPNHCITNYQSCMGEWEMACECCERKVVATDKAPKALVHTLPVLLAEILSLRPVNWEWIR